MKAHYYNKEEEVTIFYNNPNKNVYRHSSEPDIQTHTIWANWSMSIKLLIYPQYASMQHLSNFTSTSESNF